MDNKKILATFICTAIAVAAILMFIRVERLSGSGTDESLTNGAFLSEAQTSGGQSYLIPQDHIFDTGLTSTDLPALSEPAYASIAAMDAAIGDELFGIDIEVDGEHYFYPQQIMNWHRVVNNTFGERELAITYDPLTGASVVYETRKSSGEGVQLAFSGSVYNNGMLLVDSHNDLWWQMTGTLVVANNGGDIYQTVGEELAQYPSQSMRWGDWKEIFPNGQVLSNETGYTFDYAHHPYSNYETARNVYFPVNSTDNRIGFSKWLVEGLDINGERLAISKLILQADYAYNTTLGGVPLVALYDTELDMTHVYSSQVGDRVLTFVYDVENKEFTDNETGSTWSATGVATNGELKGKVLTFINAPEYYWFAWAAAYPDTRVAIIDEQRAADASAQDAEQSSTNATE